MLLLFKTGCVRNLEKENVWATFFCLKKERGEKKSKSVPLRFFEKRIVRTSFPRRKSPLDMLGSFFLCIEEDSNKRGIPEGPRIHPTHTLAQTFLVGLCKNDDSTRKAVPDFRSCY